MIKNLKELEKFLAENMMEKYTETYIIHIFNSLMEKLASDGYEHDYVVSMKYIEEMEKPVFAYAFTSDEAGLIVNQTFDITDAVNFEKFADYIEYETSGNYNDLEFADMEEFLSNLY